MILPTVVIIAGTRPEVVKMAPVYFALRESSRLRPIFLSTAQHRQMLDQALQVFGIVPDCDLNLMEPGQTLPDLTARALLAVTAFLEREKPSAILVQGDTTTVLASTLAAFYARVPVGHVEAGLRTYNFEAPWPEEMNRRVADPLCRWCFAPTEWSAENLRREQVDPTRIHVTGNTVVDALYWMRERLHKQSENPATLANRIGLQTDFARRFFPADPASNGAPSWVLVTGHRRESFGAGFANICTALHRLVERHPDLGIVYPVHLNPNVQKPVREVLGNHPRVALIPPVAYGDFLWLMERAHHVISDSGGVQEEAPSLGKPVLVMRETTERPEGVQAGTCTLVGSDPDRIVTESSRLLGDPVEYLRRSALQNPYGDGRAAGRIREILENELR